MSKTITLFRQRVYDALRQIPEGQVTTYKLLGDALGCGSGQAIGQALKHNPFAPEVPCHRVIRTDLTIGGYSGETDGAKIRKKLRLLKDEGVAFTNGRLADTEKIYNFNNA